jgi:predicted metal-dependent hydrolase
VTDALRIDELDFALRWSPRRKTVGITVDRDGSLVVAAPAGTENAAVESLVRSRLEWIHTKLAQKEMLLAGWRPKEYVPGASLSYLGRRYRLRLVEPGPDHGPLRLAEGWFELARDQRDAAREQFIAWYIRRGQEWLPRRLERWLTRVGVERGPVDVRDLGYRWGSCGIRSLNFHWRVMTLPPVLVDYVIVHELAHMLEPRHGRAFWALVARAMPDFAERRTRLAQHGAAY